jgi:O-antigen/teichoic acid export membrane protein
LDVIERASGSHSPAITVVTSAARTEQTAPATISNAGFVGRVGRGIGAMSLNGVVNIISQVTVVPIALYSWGKFRYGEWILLTGMVQFLRLTDLGLQTYVVNKLCASYARGDRKEMERTLHSSLRVQLPMALAILAAIAVTLTFVPMGRLLGLQTVAGRSVFAVCTLLSAELLLGVPMGVIAGVYRATGKLARGGVIGVVQQSSILCCTLALIWWHAEFSSVAAGRLMVAVCVTLWILHDLHHLYPWLKLWPSLGTWRSGMRMIGPGLFFLAIPLADYISVQLTFVVVQKLHTSADITRLSTLRTMANFGQLVSNFLILAVWPELTALHALEQRGLLVRIHHSLVKFNTWLVGLAGFGLLPLIPLIYPLWTAHRLVLDPIALVFLFARLVLWGSWYPSMTLLLATNRHYRVTLAILGEAVLAVGISLLLVPGFGIRGAAFAWLVADLAVSAWLVPRLACGETGDRFGALMGTAASAAIAVVIPVALGTLTWFTTKSMLVRYGAIFPAALLLGVYLMVRQLRDDERSLISNMYSRLNGRLFPAARL